MALVDQIKTLATRIATEIKTIKSRPRPLMIAASDETTALTTGLKTTFRMPHQMTLTAIRASLTTSSSSGPVTVDVRGNGVSLLTTKPSIVAGSKMQAGVIVTGASASIADDVEITIVVDAAGTGATGLKVTMLGTVG